MTTALLAVVRTALIESWVLGRHEIAPPDSLPSDFVMAYYELRIALKYWSILLGMKVQDAYSSFFFHTRLFDFGAPLTILRTILWYSAYLGGRTVAALPDSSPMEDTDLPP